jgi:hypothetical protein
LLLVSGVDGLGREIQPCRTAAERRSDAEACRALIRAVAKASAPERPGGARRDLARGDRGEPCAEASSAN